MVSGYYSDIEDYSVGGDYMSTPPNADKKQALGASRCSSPCSVVLPEADIIQGSIDDRFVAIMSLKAEVGMDQDHVSVAQEEEKKQEGYGNDDTIAMKARKSEAEKKRKSYAERRMVGIVAKLEPRHKADLMTRIETKKVESQQKRKAFAGRRMMGIVASLASQNAEIVVRIKEELEAEQERKTHAEQKMRGLVARLKALKAYSRSCDQQRSQGPALAA